MLDRVLPFQFDRVAGSGRTRPARIACETGEGETVEVIAKLSGSCDRSVTSLAIEALSACLARDLTLPTPQPYVVSLESEWIHSISDREWAEVAERSASAAFGSRAFEAGFPEWITGTRLVGTMVQKAAEILVFDALIENVDRREGNPNCFVSGDEIRIIDHELAFPDTAALIGWQPPWSVGGLHHLETPGAHIFRAGLVRREVDWDAIRAAWAGLSDERLGAYEASMPAEWADAAPSITAAVDRIKSARDRIDECLTEVRRVLK